MSSRSWSCGALEQVFGEVARGCVRREGGAAGRDRAGAPAAGPRARLAAPLGPPARGPDRRARRGARRAAGAALAFAQYLRAHYEGARLAAAAVEGEDRELRLRFACAEGERSLLLSLLGPRSNLYALDAEDRVVAALRPLGETRRDLALGAALAEPAGRAAHCRRRSLRGRARRRAAARGRAALRCGRGGRRGGGPRPPRRAALRKQRASLDKKLALLEGDLAASAEAEALSRQGELLKTRLREVRAGQVAVTLRDFATGEPVEVALDPKLTPSANVGAALQARAQGREAGAEGGGGHRRRARARRRARCPRRRGRCARGGRGARGLRRAPGDGAAPRTLRAGPRRDGARGSEEARLPAREDGAAGAARTEDLPDDRRPRDLGGQERRRATTSSPRASRAATISSSTSKARRGAT